MTAELQMKVEQAVKLLLVCSKAAGEPLEMAYSGGKDSDVILELAKMAGIPHRAIYKNTTIDPPGTIKHVLDVGAEIVRPKLNFFQLIEQKGYPTRFSRFCCSYLKEYKIMDNVVMGIRRCESRKRAALYPEPTQCRFYGSKKNHVNAIYPILDWTNDDELQFINERKIKLHPLYYREDGTIDITKRLGCMCCPLASNKKRIQEFRMYPKMLDAWILHGQRFLDAHPSSKIAKNYANVYEWLYSELNYKEWNWYRHSFFKDIERDYKELLNKLIQ